MSFRAYSYGGGGRTGLSGPVSKDLIVLCAVLFVTLAAPVLGVPFIEWLRLGPEVVRSGAVWQLVTYPFIGAGPPSVWFLLELYILFRFGSDVLDRLGRRIFWTRLVALSAAAGAVASLWHFLASLGARGGPPAIGMIQGQHGLLLLLIALFAGLNGRATIMLFFVLPIEARWLLAFELGMGFIWFLQSGDFAGFLGVATMVGLGYASVQPRSLGFQLRSLRLRVQAEWLRFRLTRLRHRRNLHVVRDDDDDHQRRGNVRGGPWVN